MMMWQPIVVGLEDVEQLARARPEQLGLRPIAQELKRLQPYSGTGSRPVSAIRPANTETIAGVSSARPPATRPHLVERQDRGDVELDAGARQRCDDRAAELALACCVTGIFT